MWWEYLIVIGCLAAAVGYCLRVLSRMFRGEGGSCGSCRCDRDDRDEGTALKVVPLVQLQGIDRGGGEESEQDQDPARKLD